MMKNIIISTLLLMVCFKILPQSVITSDNYFRDPRKYLSELDTSRIETDLLIDRSLFSNDIYYFNGKDKVGTTEPVLWSNFFQYISNSHNKDTFIDNIDSIRKAAYLYYRTQNTYPLIFLDFYYNSISQESINRGDFIENNEFLIEYNSNHDSYLKHRLFCAGAMVHRLHGDQINFLIDSMFVFTNNKNKLKNIEIDFGNGDGYIEVQFNNRYRINYSSNSEYISGKIKCIYEIDQLNNDTLYSHFTFLRTGSSLVPEPDKINLNAGNLLKTDIIEPDNKIYYPASDPIEYIMTVNGRTVSYMIKGASSELEVSIILSPQNETRNDPNNSKLRRPLILTDGFDPGDKRDYYQKYYDPTPDLPKEMDYRGLFEFFDGDPSPWYSADETSPEFVKSLRDCGYDIIFINELSGDCDLTTNGKAIKDFLNEIINGNRLRDEKTEEAVFMSPSMGGVLARYALNEIEKEGNHFVKFWVSYDAPHKGAYIPIGLQYTVAYFADALFKKIRHTFELKLDKLNTVAARQMLLLHHSTFGDASGSGPQHQTGTPTHTTDFTNLYDALGNTYPKHPLTMAVTNGGTSKLYENAGEHILNFRLRGILFMDWADGYGNHNSDGTYDLIKANRGGAFNQIDFSTNGQIGYENSPGGWNPSLYSFNQSTSCPKDIQDENKDKIEREKATFMVTSSVFGFEVTRDNVYKTHLEYTTCSDNTSDKIKTPFDLIHGASGICEEHCKIGTTSIYLLDELEKDFKNSERPRYRAGEITHTNISEKVTYIAQETLSFADHGNTFTIKDGAVVNIKAGNSIKLLPGFSCETGSSVKITIGNVEYENPLKTTYSIFNNYIDYTKPSPFSGQISNYYKNYQISKDTNVSLNIQIYPNPSTGLFYVNISGSDNNNIRYEIFNNTGQCIKNGIIFDKVYEINLSTLESGIYHIKIFCNNSEYNRKIIIL